MMKHADFAQPEKRQEAPRQELEPENEQWDVFVSYASEDRDAIVGRLAEACRASNNFIERYEKEEAMTAEQHYDSLDSKQRQDLLLKIGETREEAQVLGQRDYVALGGWVKTRLKKHWENTKA